MNVLPESESLEAKVDRLFGLPRTDFVRERDRLARELRQAGDRVGATRVKSLARPSIAAWAVNQLHWRNRAELSELVSVGSELRRVQESGGDAGELRRLARRRREGIGALLETALGLLREAGHAASPAAERRIASTLEVLAGDPPERWSECPGRLVEELRPAGFGALVLELAPPRPESGEGPPVAAEDEVAVDDRVEVLGAARAALSAATEELARISTEHRLAARRRRELAEQQPSVEERARAAAKGLAEANRALLAAAEEDRRAAEGAEAGRRRLSAACAEEERLAAARARAEQAVETAREALRVGAQG